MNRRVPRPTLDGVLSLNSSQQTNTNVSIVTSSRASSIGGLPNGRDRVAASYVVSDSGAQLTLGGAYHVSSTGAHELNPVTGSATRLGRADSGAQLMVGGLVLPQSSSSLRCRHISELDMESATLIGRGSSGRTYNVLHTPSGVRVCVKQMQIDDTRHREEVKRELDALHKAASRFVIDFYGAFFQNDLGVILLVLELMEGSLLDVIRASKPRLPERSARAFALQVVLGLELLHHERHLIHRDIKPANLLFHRGGAVKIADFGVSSEPTEGGEGEAQGNKTFVGSVLFMAPERLQGQSYTYAADIWSLGITIYEAVVGCHPYKGEGDAPPSFWELLQRVVQQDEVLHSSPLRAHGGLGDTVSEELDNFVALCLAFQPEDRPTATELKSHPWLQSITLEDSEAIVAEVHVVRQTATAAASQPTNGSAAENEMVLAQPQALQSSSMLVGSEGRRQRGDALLSELVASLSR